ncbi:unnamed protein product [Urochloa humidicola]
MALAALSTIFQLLLGALFMGVRVTAANHGGKAGCIYQIDEASPPGSGLCYDRCSNGGAGLTTAESHTCFVNCVLRQGCVCPGNRGLPALLNETVRVTVTRPVVSARLDNVEEAAEEVLVVEVTFEGGEVPPFIIHVNAPEGGEFRQFEKGHFFVQGPAPTVDEKPTGRTMLRKPVREYLQRIGAGGDRTIDVSFLPVNSTWCVEHRVTISDVSIEYERTTSS